MKTQLHVCLSPRVDEAEDDLEEEHITKVSCPLLSQIVLEGGQGKLPTSQIVLEGGQGRL